MRRGLAKSNRQRFASVTDFSDALRAAAAGGLRETQWAATLAYAAGEVASHERKRSSRQRKWAMALAAAVAVNMSIYVAVGGVAHRPASPVRALPSVESRAPQAGATSGGRGDPAHARDPATTGDRANARAPGCSFAGGRARQAAKSVPLDILADDLDPAFGRHPVSGGRRRDDARERAVGSRGACRSGGGPGEGGPSRTDEPRRTTAPPAYAA